MRNPATGAEIKDPLRRASLQDRRGVKTAVSKRLIIDHAGDGLPGGATLLRSNRRGANFRLPLCFDAATSANADAGLAQVSRIDERRTGERDHRRLRPPPTGP